MATQYKNDGLLFMFVFICLSLRLSLLCCKFDLCDLIKMKQKQNYEEQNEVHYNFNFKMAATFKMAALPAIDIQ